MTKVAIVRTGELKGNAEFLPPIQKFVRYEEDIAQIKAKIEEAIDLAVGGIDNIIKPGETVLQVEELITETTTLRAQHEALRQATDGGAKLIPFVGIFFNRSGEKAFGSQQYVAVVDQPMPRWTPDECPLCQKGSEAIPPKKPRTNWELLTGTRSAA